MDNCFSIPAPNSASNFELFLRNMSAPKEIFIKGAREHNLKNIDIGFGRNRLTVVTGVSGSGKSSLVFDTLYAEGQRRYVESLSSYARQFMEKMKKPEVDYINGLCPAIAIEQKVNTRNPRSTVGTTTEIYDYLKLLFARVGRTISPVSGQEVRRHTVTDVVNHLFSYPAETRVQIMSPWDQGSNTLRRALEILLQKGFSRIYYKGGILKIEDHLDLKQEKKELIFLLIDRFSVDNSDEDLLSRAADSVQTAFFEGNGSCLTGVVGENGLEDIHTFSNLFEADNMSFEEPNVNFFSFNNPYGACKTCEGFGQILGIDENLVIPDRSLSVYEGAVAPWRGEVMSEWQDQLVKTAIKFDFPVHRAYEDLSDKERELLWAGNKYFGGINEFFKHLESQQYKIQYRVMLSRYRGRRDCPDCRGSRLRKDAAWVKLPELRKGKPSFEKSITDIVLMQVTEALAYFKNITLPETDLKVADRILTEITNRLGFLDQVGLGYLTLNRLSNSLSGGESQRINLATSLGSSLVGSMYILDEPSIGLHSRDTDRLIKVIQSLRDAGNSVIVVEHDEDIMKASDDLVDIGPLAGSGGGELIFKGQYKDLSKAKGSLTAAYLTGKEEIAIPSRRRKWNEYIAVKGARLHNLKNLEVKFPLHTLTVITGVSGSGKTSLVRNILYPALKRDLEGGHAEVTGYFDKLEGNISRIKQVEMVDQNPIGKSSRSNPVTYIKAYDSIRNLFAEQPLAKNRSYQASTFSFNLDGGRCEVCAGEGEQTIEMQFIADITIPCEGCHGKRFKEDVLEVTYQDLNISDVLDLTIDDALVFFKDHKSIYQKLLPLQQVGMGYVKLGQSSSTLSGGEAQRIKLASFLSKGNSQDPIFFIFDEPTTGLHFHDVKKLLKAFDMLIEQGHSVTVIEHNLDVVKCADWVIDLGPEAGAAGGSLVFEGLPEGLAKCKESHTGYYLKEKLN